MADAIEIKVKLDTSEIDRAADNISRKLRATLNVATGAAGGPARALRDQEAAALRLAQAQARLSTASGDLGRAQTILSGALAKSSRETVTQIGAQTQLVQIQNRAARSTRELGEAMSSLGGRLTLGVSAPLTALGIAAVKTATDFDSLKRGLTAVSGSSEAAEKQLARLKEVAKLPGLGFREAIQGSINLQAAGLSAERAEAALKAFGNALATVGKGKSELDGVILALSQIESKGKVSAEEINQLAERVPQIRQIMLRAFGTADTEVIQRAKITSRQFIDTVVNELAKLPQVTGGARNTFENLRDSIEQSLLPLGNKLLETILPAIEKLTPKILGLLEGFQKLSPETQQLAIGFGVAALAAGPLIGALGNILRLVTEIRALGGLGAVLGVGTSAAGIAALGIVGLGVAAEGLRDTIARGEANIRQQLDRTPRDLSGQPLFQVPKDVKPLTGPLKLGGPLGEFDPVTGRFGGAQSVGSAIDANALAKQHGTRQRQKTELQKAADDVKELSQKVAALRAGEGALFDELAKLDLLRAQAEILEKQQKDRALIKAKTELGIPLAPQLPGGIGLPRIPLAAAGAPGAIGGPVGIVAPSDDPLIAARNREDLANARLRIQEVQIQNQVNRGLLTEAEAQKQLGAARRAARDEIIATLEAQLRAVGANTVEGLQIIEQIERTKTLGLELSNAERFMRGFGSATEGVGDAFERLGQNVARALTSTKDLLNGLKNSVLQLFNDLLGQGLQNLVRNALAPLLGLGGGGFGTTGAAGGIGGIFRTPSTFPAQIAQAFAGAGSGLTAPASISQTQSILTAIGGLTGVTPGGLGGGGAAATTAAGAGKVSGLGGILGGIFNNVFAGGAVSAFPPLLGASLGAGFGGQSTAGRILGGIGGGAVGLGVAFGSAVFGAGGGLVAASLAALGPAALIGAPLIVGAILLGKASQRKKDEQAAGEFQRQAHDQLAQLKAGIASDQIEGAQARTIFDTQILGVFRQQISTLKTKSVVQSRLQNQTRDIEGIYNAIIVPEIEAQRTRRANQARFASIDRQLIPQFDVGGMSRGGLAVLHPNEMVLTPAHQLAVRAIAGPDVFDRVGVPGVKNPPIFDAGGVMPSVGAPPVIVINIDAVVDSEGIFIKGGRGRNGERVIANALESMRTRGRQI
jgi:tape measure domain-containing protein